LKYLSVGFVLFACLFVFIVLLHRIAPKGTGVYGHFWGAWPIESMTFWVLSKRLSCAKKDGPIWTT